MFNILYQQQKILTKTFLQLSAKYEILICYTNSRSNEIARINLLQNLRYFSNQSKQSSSDYGSSSTELAKQTISDQSKISTHVKMTERVKQTTKDVYNLSVIFLGLGIFSIVSYGIFKEFFSSKSPSGLFSTALKKCKADERIIDLLGQPIKGFGEMTSRRRARHVSFVEYENNGKTYLRIKFYLKGSMNTATVHCETDKSSPRSHVRYLYAEIDTYPKKIVILEDNRLMDDTSSSNSLIN